MDFQKRRFIIKGWDLLLKISLYITNSTIGGSTVYVQGVGNLPKQTKTVWQEKEGGMILKEKTFESGYRANGQGQELHTENPCSDTTAKSSLNCSIRIF